MNSNNQFYNLSDVGQAEDIISKFRVEYPDDEKGTSDLLSDLVDGLLADDKALSGSANDFHNFAVTIDKIFSDKKLAFAIVRKGLLIHTANTDLLADVLLYGYDSGELDFCKECYETLLTIDKVRWTWRAFSFTITYLLNQYTSGDAGEVTLEAIKQLAEDYQKYRPDTEDAWVSLCRFYNDTNQKQSAIRVLEEAIKKFRFCPKCWLRYADIMMDRGEYKKAAPVIRKMLRNVKTTEDINTSYMYYLDGQCKLQMLLDSDEYDTGMVDEMKVQAVYRAFHLARNSQGLRDGTSRQIQEYIERLEFETGIKYLY